MEIRAHPTFFVFAWADAVMDVCEDTRYLVNDVLRRGFAFKQNLII